MRDRAFPLAPIKISVPGEQLDDLRARLKATRFPLDAGNDDGYYGVRRQYLAELVDYWATTYDWRAAEAAINAYEHYRVEIDGVPVHFMRRPGNGPDPVPLILTHGWPWTFWHWSKVAGPLADPGAHGGDPADAFEVIVPSLPGFGFSTPSPARPDLNAWKVADLWHTLMTEVLGHDRYGAGGSDMGSIVTGQLGHKYAAALHAIHIGTTLPLDVFNGYRAWDFTHGQDIPEDAPEEIRRGIRAYHRKFAAHIAIHVLDSGTLSYGLTDSPAGMLAWILERWDRWSDNHGDVENVFTKDDLLTHATIYWVNNTIGTSIRLYANAYRYPWQPSHDRQPPIEAPTGITFLGYENPPGVTTENRVQAFLDSDLARWYNHVNLTVHQHGGHFMPWENPQAWTDDLRRTFRDRR
ncbi:epoxide hydrolase family protein [Streptomyces sp. NPDC001404]|uniref:epoxide hydrolase family protein n=1 Tax=Streptomyces sp. NPDC001404 TaxID=3364571 RepID=UPI003677FE45